jgi:hypothetical protein
VWRWANETIHMLQQHPVVQIFGQAANLGPTRKCCGWRAGLPGWPQHGKAVHRAYARHAQMKLPALEDHDHSPKQVVSSPFTCPKSLWIHNPKSSFRTMDKRWRKY